VSSSIINFHGQSAVEGLAAVELSDMKKPNKPMLLVVIPLLKYFLPWAAIVPVANWCGRR
jgi:hypothetical protein